MERENEWNKYILLQYPQGPVLSSQEQSLQAMVVVLPQPIASHHEQLEPVSQAKWPENIISEQLVHMPYSKKTTKWLEVLTFFTRSFNCFLPWSLRSPGVFGEEILITFKIIWTTKFNIRFFDIYNTISLSTVLIAQEYSDDAVWLEWRKKLKDNSNFTSSIHIFHTNCKILDRQATLHNVTVTKM